MIAFLLAAVLSSPVTIAWPDFFSKVSSTGVAFSERARSLEGKRVRLRGYSVTSPKIDDGLLLTRMPYGDPHNVDETDIPFDAVAVIWRKDVTLPPIPRRPTVEGVLHLGNRDVGPAIVSVSLEDATPVMPEE